MYVAACKGTSGSARRPHMVYNKIAVQSRMYGRSPHFHRAPHGHKTVVLACSSLANATARGTPSPSVLSGDGLANPAADFPNCAAVIPVAPWNEKKAGWRERGLKRKLSRCVAKIQSASRSTTFWTRTSGLTLVGVCCVRSSPSQLVIVGPRILHQAAHVDYVGWGRALSQYQPSNNDTLQVTRTPKTDSRGAV